jgi:S1-C subfamily serine protease
MRRFVAFGPAIVVLVVAALALHFAPMMLRQISAARTAQTISVARDQLDAGTVLDAINEAVRTIAQSVEPSVVHIEVDGSGFGGSSGSGWVYDNLGHVVTNAHVVRNARMLRVQFYDGRVVEGELKGADSLTDVAVIRVAATDGLFPARRAPDVNPQQGDRVYAFGSPFGLKFSMSEGIISGLGRVAGPALEMGGFSNLIQTDAAVNPGNSGGPLVDSKGRVVGMNVAIATARDERGVAGEGQSAGISFAIPIAVVENVCDQLISVGRVSRGFLGISFGGVDQISDGDRYRGTGVRVNSVEDGGPAALAGLRRGDVIVAIQGQPTPSFENVRSIVGTSRAGERVRVRYWRANEFRETEVVLAEMTASALVRGNPAIFTIRETGMQVVDTPQGPVIFSVIRGGPAALARLGEGQVILAVGATKVSSVADFAAELVNQGWLVGKDLELTVADIVGERVGDARTVVLRPITVR